MKMMNLHVQQYFSMNMLSMLCNRFKYTPLPSGGRQRKKSMSGGQTRGYPHIIYKWTSNWFHVYRQQMLGMTDTECRMTMCRSYSRQAVNSLCETIISHGGDVSKEKCVNTFALLHKCRGRRRGESNSCLLWMNLLLSRRTLTPHSTHLSWRRRTGITYNT